MKRFLFLSAVTMVFSFTLNASAETFSPDEIVFVRGYGVARIEGFGISPRESPGKASFIDLTLLIPMIHL